MPDTFRTRYAALIAAGEIEADPGQLMLAGQLSALAHRLEQRRLARKSSSLGWLFGKREQAGPLLKGLYVHGEVGRGKTMLMDLFFATSVVKRKRRVHFHEFMADVHERVHALSAGDQERRAARTGSDPARRRGHRRGNLAVVLRRISRNRHCRRHDPRPPVHAVVRARHSGGGDIEPGARANCTKTGSIAGCFCLSSRCCSSIARSFGWMRVSIFGSRSSPACRPGMCRPMRRPIAALDDAWRRLAGEHAGSPHELVVKGHIVRVPKAAMGVARFSFDDLCAQPLAAADYLKIAHEFHTVVLDRIPVMDHARRNEAKRFIILIDTLYDHAVKLLASAQAQPDELYTRHRRLRSERIQAHRLAPDRDAFAILSRPAARSTPAARPEIGRIRSWRPEASSCSGLGAVGLMV